MGWLQSVGSTQLQVSCTGYRLFYGALLQKRPIFLSVMLVASTPEVFDTLCETLVPSYVGCPTRVTQVLSHLMWGVLHVSHKCCPILCGVSCTYHTSVRYTVTLRNTCPSGGFSRTYIHCDGSGKPPILSSVYLTGSNHNFILQDPIVSQ